MRPLFVVAVAACLLAAAVAMEAPATLVDRQLDTLTDGRLRVANSSGRLWNGSGELTLLPYGARVPVAWHIDMLPLLRSRLNGTLTPGATDTAQTAFELSAEDFAVRRLALALPAEALLRAGGAPGLLTAAGGTVDVQIDAFAMRRGMFEGGFLARWQGASLVGPSSAIAIALGDMRLEAIGNGSELKGALSNAGGEIEVNGTLILSATGAARAEARLKPREGVDPARSNAIAAALSLLGSMDSSGAFRVTWQAPGR